MPAPDVAVVVCFAGYRHLPPLEAGACDEAVRALEGLGFASADIVRLLDPDLATVRSAVADVRGDGRVWVYVTGYLARFHRSEAPRILGLDARSADGAHALPIDGLGAHVVLADAVAAPGREPVLGGWGWPDDQSAVDRGSVASVLAGGADGLLGTPDGLLVADELVAGVNEDDPITTRAYVAWTAERCEVLARLPGTEAEAYAWPDGPAPSLALTDRWHDRFERAASACKRRYSEARVKELLPGCFDGLEFRAEMLLRLADMILMDADEAALTGATERARDAYARTAKLAAAGLFLSPSTRPGELRRALGCAQAALGDPAAEATLRQAAASGTPHVAEDATLALGDLLAEKGRLAEALVAYGRVPGEWRIHGLYRAGWVHLRLGDVEAARTAWLAVLAGADERPNAGLGALRTATGVALARLAEP